jgi:hypothetical protein
MKNIFSRQWIVALQVTACVLVLPACQLSKSATQATGVPVTGNATAGTIQANVEFGSGPLRLVDPTAGLPDLSSYKATLTLSFDGTKAGQPNQWSRVYVMLASHDPAAHQLTIETAGGVPAPLFMAEVNGMSYERRGEKDCTASATEADNSLSAKWEPAGFLPGIIGADTAGAETVNGVATNHYTFDERALGEAGLTKSTGQVWVASEKGYVVRVLLATKAGADYFGEGVDGTLTWEYNLTDINKPVLINLPAGCPGGLVDMPLMPDAQNVRRLPGVTIYSSAGSLQDVFAFYKDKLPPLGWVAAGEPGVTDTVGVATFVQGDQQLSVIATKSENTVTVRLVIGAALSLDAIPGFTP